MMEYVLTCIVSIISYSTHLLIYKIFTNDKLKINVLNVVLLFVICITTSLLRYWNMMEINLLTNFIFIVVLLMLFYRAKIKKSLYYMVILSVITLLSDAITSMIISSSALANYNAFKTNVYFRTFLVIPVSLVELVFAFILHFCFKRLISFFYEKFIGKVKLKKTTVLFFAAGTVLIIIFFCLNGYSNLGKGGHLFMIISIVSFVILFLITLNLIYREYQYEQVNRKVIEENNYIKNIAKQDQEFKHNIINDLIGIKTIANKKTGILIDELINDYQTEYKNVTNINELPNGIQSIIYKKAYEENIDDLNLVVDNNVKCDLYDVLSPKQYINLCTSIGIVFDNALDAVKSAKEKVIFIELEEDEHNIYLTFMNSFSAIIDIDKTGSEYYTTKKYGHGIGLNYIHRLKTLRFSTEIFHEMFTCKIITKKKKNKI